MARRRRRHIPVGWYLADHLDKENGTTIKCYTNALGQKFFSMKDLLRYVKYAVKAKLSIYSPDFNASTVSKSKPLEVRNLKPDSEAKDTQINLPLTTNAPSSSRTRKQAKKAGGVEHSKNPGVVSPPVHNSNRTHGSKNPVSASVTDAQPCLASRGHAGLQQKHSQTINNNGARRVTHKLESTRASKKLAGHQASHLLASSINDARPVTNKLEKNRSSRRIAGLADKNVSANF